MTNKERIVKIIDRMRDSTDDGYMKWAFDNVAQAIELSKEDFESPRHSKEGYLTDEQWEEYFKSRDLEDAAVKYVRPMLDKSLANYGEGKQMELTKFDGYNIQDAFEAGAGWQRMYDVKHLHEPINAFSDSVDKAYETGRKDGKKETIKKAGQFLWDCGYIDTFVIEEVIEKFKNYMEE